MQIEDKILFGEIAKQNLKVYEILFRDYYPHLICFAEGFVYNRQECEDIVQNLFLYLWENASKIELQSSLRSYLFQSVKNRCLNHLRDLHLHDRHNLLYIEAVLNSDQYDDFYDSEILGQIASAISSLPVQMAEVIKMKYLQGMKVGEISESLNISQNTVKTHLSRGREKLKRTLLNTTSLNFLL